MRKTIAAALFLACVAASMFVLTRFFPNYHGMIVFLGFFLLGDIILWSSVRRICSKLGNSLKRTISFFFWLPAMILFGMVAAGFIVPFIHWDVTLKAILLSLLTVTIAAKVPPLAVSLVTGILRILPKWRSKGKQSKNHWPEIWSWIAGAALLLLLVTGMFTWVFSFKINRVDVTSPRISPCAEGFRIVQISDIHLGNWTSVRALQRAVDLINSLEPDVIVFTGDMFNYSTDEGWRFFPVLKKLNTHSGTFAIMGNHDYGDYVTWPDRTSKLINLRNLKKFYDSLHWELLLNSNRSIRFKDGCISVIGVENWGASRRFQRYGNIVIAEQGIEKQCFNILLSHDPSYWDSIVSKKHPEIDLTLSGHTHGGQFGADIAGFRWSILSLMSPFWGGMYETSKGGFRSKMYVNVGLGTVGYAGRIGIKPEITLLVLHAQKPSP
jgi:predicted MPP superfamily phosphohydrolase